MNDDSAASTGARSFGSVARTYDKGRPGYPAAAVTWLVGGEARTVLELGAGTGKLTEELVRQGHDVHATDPDPEMLRVLRERCPDVRTSIATAEAIPVPDRSVDVVVAAQSFHWFDRAVALPEISRVLRPGGQLAVAWNTRDERIPWVRRLGRILHPEGRPGHPESAAEELVRSEHFGFVESEAFPFWQTVDRHSIVDLVASRSQVITLSPELREAKVAEVLALYDDYGRGMDGMQLPYRCECHRARVNDRTRPTGGPHRPGGPGRPDVPDAGGGSDGDRPSRPGGPTPPPADGETGEMLLIDFR